MYLLKKKIGFPKQALQFFQLILTCDFITSPWLSYAQYIDDALLIMPNCRGTAVWRWVNNMSKQEYTFCKFGKMILQWNLRVSDTLPTDILVHYGDVLYRESLT